MPAIEITRKNLSISQLGAEAARTADAKQARRLLSPSKDGHCHGAGWACAAAIRSQSVGQFRQRRRSEV